MTAGEPWRGLLLCSSVLPVAFHASASSSGESDDWEQSGGRLASTDGGMSNIPYLPDEEEEEDDVADVEQGQERGKVTVRNLQADQFQTGLLVV